MAQAERKRKAKKKEQEQRLEVAMEEVNQLELPMMIGLGVVGLIIFVMTLNPHMGPGDSGTIITMSYLGGINHPPGYPLYTMLGNLFSYLPFGSVGFRINFMNAVMTVAATLVFFKSFIRVTKNPWAALIGSGLLCFAPGIWHYAVTAEVFPLNNLMIALLFYFLVLYTETLDKKYAYLGTLMFGLGMSNHHTIFFFGFPFAALVLIKGREELLNPIEILKICGIFFIGLIPYLFLVLTPKVGHIESWGDTATWDGFFVHLFRREYGTFSLRSDLKGGGFIQGITEYFKQLPFELIFIGPIVAAYGVYQTWKKKLTYNGIFMITVVAFVLYVVAFHAMSKFDLNNPYYYGIVYRFWQMPLLIVSFWVALGVKELMEQKQLGKTVIASIAVIVISIQIGLNYSKQDQSKNDIYFRLGRNILESLPKNAIALIKGDIFINSMIYAQWAQGIRPDVVVLNIGRMKGPWYAPKAKKTVPRLVFPGRVMVPIGFDLSKTNRPDLYTIEQFIKANLNHSPIFTNLHYQAFKSGNKHFDLWPWGLLHEVKPLRTPMGNYRDYIAKSKSFILKFEEPKFTPTKNSHEEIVNNYFKYGLGGIGLQLANLAGKNKWPHDFVRLGLSLYKEQQERNDTVTAQEYKNIGLLFSILPGIENQRKKQEAWKKFLQMANPNEPGYGQIRKRLQQDGVL